MDTTLKPNNDKAEIDAITAAFFNVFNNTNQRIPDWTILKQICINKVTIIKKTGNSETIYDLETFISPRKIILTDGSLTDFQEMEVAEESRIAGNIAQRISSYKKSGNLNGNPFNEKGTKLFQFIKTVEGWKISSVVWEDH